jgi:hypothetical protein
MDITTGRSMQVGWDTKCIQSLGGGISWKVATSKTKKETEHLKEIGYMWMESAQDLALWRPLMLEALNIGIL